MRWLRPLSGCLALAFLAGCYTLGPTNGVDAGDKSVRLDLFTNKTLEPRLTDAVATALRHNVQRDGTYHIASGGSADIVIDGTITHYDRHELSFVPKDVLTVTDFRISVTAQVTARDVNSGRMIFNRPVSGYTLVRVGSDLTSAERQALPMLADDLAKNITALLVDGAW